MRTDWKHKAFALGLVGAALYGIGYWVWRVMG